MNCQLNIFESLSTFLPKMVSPNPPSEVLPSLPGRPRTWDYDCHPKNSMHIPVAHERAGAGTAVIGNRSRSIWRNHVGIEIHHALAGDRRRLGSHSVRR